MPNLSFVLSDDVSSEIRVTFDPNDGAWSYLGTDCRRIPLNQATMNLGFQDGGTSGHEFGHVLPTSTRIPRAASNGTRRR